MSRMCRKDQTLVLVFALLSIALWFVPTGFEERVDASALRARGRVIEADNAGLQRHALIKVGAQQLVVEVLDGPLADSRHHVVNQLLGRLDVDKVFAPGEEALLVITRNPDGSVNAVVAQDHYRIGLEAGLFGLFALLLLVFGGWTGAKALLSFIFTGLVLWKVFIPALLTGIAPVPLAFGVVALLTSGIIFLVAGPTRLGVVAFSGAMLGVGASSALAVWAAKAFHLNGAVMPFAETLLYSGYAHLDLTGIYVAAIFVAASGAVMDLAMDVAASQNELVTKAPDITMRDALWSGIRVGRSVVGTMTTTLLLAYSGGYVTLLMAFMAQGVPLINIFNLLYVAAEVVKTIVGSFGLVLVAPFTAVVGAIIYTRPRRQKAAAAEMLPHCPEIAIESR
ncbi:YibE/F family protein [Desulfovibrio subterraneus]|uniref:Membrane protein n=1 Tax=Desulfovibrio subterraneus TaxID=2718620 RepID=A0A7J0BMN2_9BACT|nr:YibE/F family protein [Desulfovibrio subterraneus]WBF68332.1 YibE/F family protein [Desulfovibrio subterraneus]GFM34284.1 membrane protein [Desulfovibrio subterraneus]